MEFRIIKGSFVLGIGLIGSFMENEQVILSDSHLKLR